jgi:hypothetical protein
MCFYVNYVVGFYTLISPPNIIDIVLVREDPARVNRYRFQPFSNGYPYTLCDGIAPNINRELKRAFFAA